MIRNHLLNRRLHGLSKFVFKDHLLYSSQSALIFTRRIARMLMILLAIVRIAYRDQAAHIVSFWDSEGFHYARSVESAQIHSSLLSSFMINPTPTLALSQHHELLHKERGVLVRPALDGVRLALVASSSEGFLHAGEKGFLLQEHWN